MSNFKRGKTKRRVRCTMCTKFRWRGNNNGRRSHSDARRLWKG